jgi:hypothetical protein
MKRFFGVHLVEFDQVYVIAKGEIMSFTFQNLDSVTRKYMLQELDTDISNGNLYLSKRLTSYGQQRYPALIREAIEGHDDVWLAQRLQLYMSDRTSRRTRGGATTVAKVPYDAHETLAEGEFNRYYMRGVCARAIAEGIESVEVYRGKQVSQPRSESQARIGQRIPPQALLSDLRASIGTDAALGLPSGPNSGLTIRIPS